MILTDKEALHKKSDEATKEEALEIIALLDKELSSSNSVGLDGVGLAAPQIGIYKKVAIVRLGKIIFDLVNCNISKQYDKIITEEGCLSIPGKSFKIERYNQIVVENNKFGNYLNFCAYGLPAVVVQHEMDHWDGILIEDKAIVEHVNIGPNMNCPCGKKLKYKKCCGKSIK